MPPSRPLSAILSGLLAALSLCASAQDALPIPPPPPSKHAAETPSADAVPDKAKDKDKPAAPAPAPTPAKAAPVPIFDTPPSLTLPLPKKTKEKGNKDKPAAEPKAEAPKDKPAPAKELEKDKDKAETFKAKPNSNDSDKEKAKDKDKDTAKAPDKPAPEKPVDASGPLRAVVPMTNAANVSPTNSSTTEMGQFVIHGADLSSRTYITNICEETADDLSQLLHDTEHYEIPIVVAIKTPPNVSLGGPAVSTDIAELSFGGFRLQVTLQVRPDFNVNDFRAELTRMLIAERILRGSAKITTKRTRILPDWLLVGIKEAQRYRSRSRPSAVFATIFRTGKVYSIDDILEASPGSLDSLSRTIYETSCCALVLALLDQPDGNIRMEKFLRDLASDSKTDREMLNHWFPGLNASKSSLNKWWSLQMASLATPTIFETLGPSETAKQLDEALELHYETTPADAPATHVASADEAALKADAEKETKKRNFLTRLFSKGEKADKTDKSDKPAPPAESLLPKGTEAAATPPSSQPGPKPAPASDEPPPAAKPLSKTDTDTAESKPAAKPKAKPDAEPKSQPKSDLKPKAKTGPAAATPEPEEASDAPAKPGFSMRRLFGFGGSTTTPAEDAPVKDDKPKPEVKKPAKPAPAPAPEPKKEAPPKETAKPKATEPPPPAREASKPKAQPTAKPAPEAKAEDDADKPKPSFLGRMFGGKKAPADEPKPEDTKDQPKAKTKPKKAADGDKPSAAVFDSALMLRALADVTVPGLSVALNASHWLDTDEPRFTAFPFFSKKSADPAADADKAKEEPAKPGKAKEDAKPKEKEESKPKKPRLVPVSVPITDYNRVIKRPEAKTIFKNTAVSLAGLATRANPLFRPLIREYIELLADLSNHKTKDIDARLKALREERDEALTRAKQVRDYLDWYEASESDDYSSAFDDYLRLPHTIDQEIPRRADPISKLLDEMEQRAEK